MPSLADIDLTPVADQLGLPLEHVQQTARLLEEGNTVAFVTRYRKDATGGLNEEQVQQVHDGALRLRMLAERKQTILKSIESQGKLTEELAADIQTATSTKRLEDLYLPYKPKKQTLATQARQRGLAPFAEEITEGSPKAADLQQRAVDFVCPDRHLNNAAEVLHGVGHLLAERFSERAEVRAALRDILRQTGRLVTAKATGSQEEENASPSTPPESSNGEPQAESPKPSKKAKARDRKKQQLENTFREYFDYCEAVDRIPPHRILAINRGERAKVLRVKVEGDADRLVATALSKLVDPEHPHASFLEACARDALSRLILPSLERELRRELTEMAEEQAVRVFARNLRKLLLQPPVRDRRVLAIDPAYRTGCKLAALDEFGNVLETGVVHVIGGDEQVAAGRQVVIDLLRRHQLTLVAIGNGSACRVAEEFVSALLSDEFADSEIAYVIVNGAGASTYSTSPLGREELPELDPVLRSAVSIGRRLLDPLSELVKIQPANIGVGLYQHDVKAKHLRESLDAVVASCVNYVGVELNTASPALLSYVSGLNQLTARRIYEYRCEHGPFTARRQLLDVPGIGEATYVQAAGFLKIRDGDNPLDATWIHPESYDTARRVLEKLGSSLEELAALVKHPSASQPPDHSATGLRERANGVDVAALAGELGVGKLLLHDLLNDLTRPGRDPRDDLPPPVFRRGIVKLEHLKPGMELAGRVLNVVDFGAFVDIGISGSALIHISRLADRFVRDPHEVVSVGDTLRVWVIDVDRKRRRVSLSALGPPGRKPAKERPAGRPPQRRRARPQSRSGGSGKRRRPATPISDAMIEGREPMRSFGDLLQYYEKKRDDEKKKP